MADWFKIKKTDVIALLEKRKDRFPWGYYPNEKYTCLIFWYEDRIRICVNMFNKCGIDAYECLCYYTGIIGDKIEDYNKLTEDELASIAYNAWCTGAR